MDQERISTLVRNSLLAPIKLIRSLIYATGVLVWLLIFSGSAYLFYLLEALPAESSLSLASLRQQTQQVISKRYDQAPATPFHWSELRVVNRDLLYAIVLSEDGRFFTHQGVDYDALLSALAENLKSRQWKFGASTISQQTVKNIFLNNDKTLSRKFQEVILTRRLESALSKNEILEVYLNLIEFGPDIFGIHQACAYYFNKTPEQINAAEGAYLALLMPSPRKYHYTLFQNGNWSPALKKKHRRILRDMRYKELISASQYKSYQQWAYSKDNISSDG